MSGEIIKMIKAIHEKYAKLGYRFGRYSVRQGIQDGVADAREKSKQGWKVVDKVIGKNRTPYSVLKWKPGE